MLNKHLSFIGAGNMATYIIQGLIKSNYPPQYIWVSNRNKEKLNSLSKIDAINTTSSNHKAAARADVVFVCVKPQQVIPLLEEISSFLAPHSIIISIAAGVSIDILAKSAPNNSIIRAMPNIAVQVQDGMTGLISKARLDKNNQAFISQIFSYLGKVLWCDSEEELHTVTAVSGSGPAYFLLVTEMLINSAIDLGLSASSAQQLVCQTFVGCAKMFSLSSLSASELRDKVTSKGGTTAAAVNYLQSHDLQDTFTQAVICGVQRSKELDVKDD